MDLGEEILKAEQQAPRREDVTGLVPQWAPVLKGKRLYVQAMDGWARNAWEAERRPGRVDEDTGKYVETVNGVNLYARSVARCLVTEDGKRVFADPDKLGKGVSGATLAELYSVFLKVNGLLAKDAETSLKNAPGGAGSSTPPGSSDAQPENSLPLATPQS